MNKKNIWFCSLFFALSGCHQQEYKKPVGMANPASVYCEELHGKSILMNSSQGQYADCILPSGERIEEWSLFRRDHALPKKGIMY